MDVIFPDKFLQAQERMFPVALAEIRGGGKRSHWIWYIFPQHRELGYSSNSGYYGIANLDVARALLDLGESDPVGIMGKIDALKLRSSMTLFEKAAPDVPEFALVLEKFYGGKRDQRTIALLRKDQ